MTTDTEKYTSQGTWTETSDNLNSGNAGDRQYNMTNPLESYWQRQLCVE